MKTPSVRSRPSVTSPYDRPRRHSGRSDSDLGDTRSRSSEKRRVRPRLEPLDFAGVRRGTTTELSTSASKDKDSGCSTPASLRRASTLTLSEEEPAKGAEPKLKESRDSPKPVRSASKKDGMLRSSLKKLSSGSIVGETSVVTSEKEKSETEKSKTGKSKVKRRVTDQIVSFFLEQIMLSKPDSSSNKDSVESEAVQVDEENLPEAIQELKSKLSKTASQSSTLSNRSSTRASKGDKSNADNEEAMDTTEKSTDPAIAPSRESSKRSVTSRKSSIRSRTSQTSTAHKDVPSEKAGDSADMTDAAVDDDGAMTGKEKEGVVDDDARTDTDKDNDGGVSAVSVPLPPAGLVEVAISFDTTGSMYHCLEEVRAKIQDLVQRLQADIPGIRFAIIAHGDYCDVDKYVIKWIDFGASLPELCDFVKNVEDTYGGDGPECYELVLQRAREALSWTPGSRRVLIVINDDVPHGPTYRYKGEVFRINWKEECVKLRDMGVVVYGVQSGGDEDSSRFNAEMARLTGGRHVKLAQFSSVLHFITMICYREGNPDMLPLYEDEIRNQGPVASDVDVVARTFGADSSVIKPGTGSKSRKPSVKSRRVESASVTKPPRRPAKTIKRLKGKDPATAKRGGKGETTTEKKAKAKPTATKRKALKGETVLKRERLPDSYMTKGELKHLEWTPWTKAITPELPKSKLKTKFAKCTNYPGFRLKQIFNSDSQVPAIYEFAVQGPGSAAKKKHVVYFRKTIGHKTVRFWDLYLFRHISIRKEIERAVSRGCAIWIRRGIVKGRRKELKKKKELVNKAGLKIKTTLDYAWKKYLWRKQSDGRMFHRAVSIKKKGGPGIPISWDDL